ncbi:putative E3 ubiquitin-protein ligase UBR7 [Portunus trituberculatus]|uniref:Putative E3 ubiquitin-protein ligase UBR7 n=1 Tax=Portunus trituberculatus TaxID=210409 RepID=A0A5B7GSM1_PORTR|nr:putative E3 ubiquitin-protein ligase UBR7 [Portunus trituberculatus]
MTKHTLPKGALFFPNSWRQQLCVCENCKATYKDEGIVFLLDDEDTVNFYEESGKSHQPSSSAPVQRELEALSSLDRVVRTEMVHGKKCKLGVLSEALYGCTDALGKLLPLF